MDEIEISPGMYHELRHLRLGDFGRNIRRAEHSKKGEPRKEVDDQTDRRQSRMRRKSRKLRFVPIFFRLSATVVLILVSSIGELINGQTDISAVRSLINWSCVKDEPFLRDDKGQAVWFDSDALQKFVVKQTSMRPPGLLGKNNLYGKVTLQLLIGKNGRPRCVRGIEGHTMAISSAVEAVSKWIFKPYKVKGKPVPILGWVTIEYDFRK